MKVVFKLLKKLGMKVFDFPILEKIKGYKTLIISFLVMLIGLLVYLQEFLNGGVGEIACNLGITIFCNLAGSKFYGALLIGIGFLNKILRLVTETKVPFIDDENNFDNNKK